MLETRGEAERRLRQKMRVYPQLATQGRPLQRQRESDEEAEQRRYEDAERKAIVSLHGEDLSSEDEIKKLEQKNKDSQAA